MHAPTLPPPLQEIESYLTKHDLPGISHLKKDLIRRVRELAGRYHNPPWLGFRYDDWQKDADRQEVERILKRLNDL